MNIWYGTPAMTASRTAILENGVAPAFPAAAPPSAGTGCSGRSIARFMLPSSHCRLPAAKAIRPSGIASASVS